MDVTSDFSFPIAYSWGFSSLNSTSSFSRVQRGVMPKNHWSSLTEFGNSIFVISSIFPGPTFKPSDDIICPRNKMDFIPV